VIYEQADDGGLGTYLPDLPGVVALGASRVEVTKGVEQALRAYSGDLLERGESLQPPHHATGTVAA
jgi:predicted RNase H-like HicB family nuclease